MHFHLSSKFDDYVSNLERFIFLIHRAHFCALKLL